MCNIVWNTRKQLIVSVKWPYLRNRSSDLLHIWLYGGVFGDGGSNGAIFDSNKFKMAAAAILDNFELPYLRNSSRSTYIARIARSSLRQHSFLVCHVTVVWRSLAEEHLAISKQSIHRWKVYWLQFRRWQYGSIFIRLAVIASETREMWRNSKRIWLYSSSRSSKVIDLCVNDKPMWLHDY